MIPLLFSALFSCTLDNEKEELVELEKAVPFCGNASIEKPDAFKRECASCHKLNQDMTGPALKSVLVRGIEFAWFNEFLRNEEELIQRNDSLTMTINEEWGYGPAWKHNYDSLTDEEIRELWTYSTGW